MDQPYKNLTDEQLRTQIAHSMVELVTRNIMLGNELEAANKKISGYEAEIEQSRTAVQTLGEDGTKQHSTIKEQKVQIVSLCLMLEQAARTFRFYESQHAHKGTEEGDRKATFNREQAEEIEKLLKTIMPQRETSPFKEGVPELVSVRSKNMGRQVTLKDLPYSELQEMRKAIHWREGVELTPFEHAVRAEWNRRRHE